VLEHLEEGDRQSNAKTMIDDLPLFHATAHVMGNEEEEPDELRIALKDVNPDDLSPRQAHEMLYQLKGMLQ
jgi:DNA mismatch repair protein MutS